MKKMDETEHLLGSKKHVDRLLAAIKSLREGEDNRATLAELKPELNFTGRGGQRP